MSVAEVFSRSSRIAVVTVGLVAAAGFGVAQDKPSAGTVPDAQVEANVLKALAGAPELADQAISTTTVYGTVTLSGSVRDEASRTKAEQIVATTPGVKKVVDELVIGGAPAAQASQPAGQAPMNQPEGQPQGSNPNLQSDGTMATPGTAPEGDPANGNLAPNAQQYPPQGPPQGQYPQQYPPQQAQQQPQYPQQQNAPYGYPQGQPQAQGQPAYPPPPYRHGYPYGPPPAYAQQPVIQQQGGQTVVVPNGTVLMVRTNQALDSQKTQPGTAFDGIVMADVIVGNQVAIPRGASVQGVVGDVRAATPLRGRGGLALQLTQVTLEGKTYPLVTGDWTQVGVDKTGHTVANTVGLGAMGALIGGAVGGGPGALLGAGVGSVAGLGVSAAGSGAAKIPAEALLSFKLTQQAAITTVSQAELDRLGAGVPQPPLQRRYPAYPAAYPPPPPPPGYYYYGGRYYAYPYPYYGYYR